MQKTSYILSTISIAFLLVGATLLAVHASPPDSAPVLLRLQSGSFDPLHAPARFAVTPSSPYAIVQFTGPVQPAWRAALERSADILGYLPDYAYIVRLPSGQRAALRRLPGVRWVGDVLPAYRVDPELWGAAGTLTLTVQLFPGEDPAPVTHRPGVRVLDTARTHWQTTLRLTADAAILPDMAALPGVRWIEPAPAPRLLNDVAAELTGVTAAGAALDLTGSGQIVAVADTGLDVGASGPLTDFAGRVVSAYGVGRPGTWDDPHGHGTHVAGTILGSGALSGSAFQGMAPDAQLVVQSLYSPTAAGGLAIPADLTLLFSPAYTDGARIHNNSWGTPGNRYNTHAQTADQFVWDHPDMLIVVAAGNGGIDRGGDGLVDPGSLYSPATAKNVLAVGAAESRRSGQGYTGTYGDSPDGGDFPADPVHSDLISDDPGGLAAFSSRGPTADGRIRPDMVAPGTNILSARSHHPSAVYAFPYDDHYAFESGSSQAAPVASGAAALVRQWLAAQGEVAPSAALVRALLVNGATNLSPGQYGPAVTGTVVAFDDVESTPVWTSTTWAITDTYGVHSPGNAWVAGGIGTQYLDATLDLSGVTSPTLIFWNRRALAGSWARVTACGVPRPSYNWSNGTRIGWAQEAVDIAQCAGNAAALVRFEIQCIVLPCATDVWALDDIAVVDGGRLAEVETAPDAGQGWGRLNLTASLALEEAVWYADVVPGLQTGEVVTFTLPALVAGARFQATLVWPDYPALPNAAVAWVNDLDVTVVDPSGNIHYPNGLAGPERANTVERAGCTVAETGVVRVVVRGANVPFGPQPFALVVSPAYESMYLPLIRR
ncbi:MAG: S8 family serine peptidase [Anaerolineae bacterium]|nr:S8 family serine peptidase [Anaerolineae bacterium]